MDLTIVVSGLENIQALTDPDSFRNALDRGIDRAAERMRDDTKKLPPVSAARTGFGKPGVPVDTGRMRQAIQKKKMGLLAAGVYAGTNYSGYVHEGTKSMPARPFFEWGLTEFGGADRLADALSDELSKLFG